MALNKDMTSVRSMILHNFWFEVKSKQFLLGDPDVN